MIVTLKNDTERVVLSDSPFRLLKKIDLSGLAGNHTFAETNQDGSLHLSSKYAQRDIEIEGLIFAKGKDRGWLQEKKNLLYRLCNPKNRSTIIFENGDELYSIDGYPISFPTFDTTTTSNYQRFLLQLTCSDPYLYKAPKIKIFAEVTPQFSFPLSFNAVSFGEKQNTLIETIYNEGMMDCSVDITITAHGDVVNPYLLNLNTREQVKLNTSLMAGDVVTIRTGREKEVSLTRNGVKSPFFHVLDLSSSFILLHPGDNVFRFGCDVGNENLQIQVAYQERVGGL